MPDSSLDIIADSSLQLRNDGAVTNLINGGLLFNRQTGMGTSKSGGYHTHVGSGYLLSESELRSLHRSNWLIKRVCNVPSFDMTKQSIELKMEDGDEDDVSKVMSRWRSPIQDVSPYSKKASYSFDKARQEAERWARLFGSAYIVLKVNGDEDPKEPLQAVRSLDAIAVLDAYSMRPSGLDYDKTDPEFYELIYDRNKDLGYRSGGFIHESRVLPFYGEILHPFDQQMSNGQSDSVVQAMFESFMNHYEVNATLKEAINSFSLLTVSVNRLSELLAAGKEAAVKNYLQEVALQKSVYRILVTDPEASKTGFEGRNLTGVRENIELFREEMTASSGLPFYKLWGTVGRAGLADSGANEARAYAELVSSWQGSKFLDNDQRIIKILSQLEIGRIPESFKVDYPSIYEPTSEELLSMEETKARIYQAYSTLPNVVKAQELRKAIATGQSLENIIDLDEAPSGVDEEQLIVAQPSEAEAITPSNDDSGHEQLVDRRTDFSYVKRILKWNGLELGLEYLPGDRRFNKKMRAAYGHIRKHIGADGEALDCYVSRDFIDDYTEGIEWEGDRIFRITQLSRDDGDFDEHKYIIGVNSLIEAEALYRTHMPDWAFGGVDEVDLSEVRSHRRDSEPVEATGRILSAEEWDELSNVSEDDVLRILGEVLE
ncbi:MAG: phage portal protein [Cyanobacteria bacterium J06627_8]